MHRPAIFQLSQPNTNQASFMRGSRGGPRDISVFRNLTTPPLDPCMHTYHSTRWWPSKASVGFWWLLNEQMLHIIFIKYRLPFRSYKKICISIHDLYFHFIQYCSTRWWSWNLTSARFWRHYSRWTTEEEGTRKWYCFCLSYLVNAIFCHLRHIYN